MTLIKLFLVVLFVTLSFATNSEIYFSNLDEEIIIGKERLQAYTNDLEEEGSMVLKLILESGKEYNLSSMVCRVGKGQFNWVPPNTIPDNSVGVFEYVINVDGDEFSGTSEKMRFVSTPSSSSDTTSSSDPSSSSDSSLSSVPSSSNTSSSSDVTSSSSTTKRTTTTRISTTTTERRKTTTTSKSSSTETIDSIDNISDNNFDSNSQNGNGNAFGMPEQPLNSTSQQPAGNTNDSITQNKSFQGVDNSNNPENKNYLIYIGGGSGIVVVALTGLFVAYRVKSRRSLSEYEFDSRPYNNTSMDISQMPNLLNGNLASVNILGSPSFNDTSKGSQYGLYNNNNNPKSYHVPNIESGGSGLLLSPDLSNMTSNFYNTSQKEKDKSKRNTYEMISPYDPRETSYQNFNGNFDESLVLDNNGIINLNSSSNMNLNVDINSKLPKSENYCANPRSGSLPRNRVPNELAVPLMNEGGDEEENKKNYRSSILSYISSNRGSYYGDNADHSISHILLNHVCTVAYASQPENEDELYLKVGDKVKILEVYDDGWACALQISTGLEGMIPLNCTAEYYQ